MSGTFTCESCGETHEKGWSDEEAAAEAQGLFPGIDVSDPAETGVVCDDCYKRIMARARAEAPELTGEGWRGDGVKDPARPMPAAVFSAFIRRLTDQGYARNDCLDHCQDRGSEHAHLRTPDGDDVILWADGRFSGWDLTQPARFLYPAPPRRAFAPHPPGPLSGSCYRTESGFPVHIRPGCRCPR